MAKPLLTVCIITYNHAAYIRQAIDGVLNQQVSFDWELVIADDFSTDGTREILLDYQRKHPDFIKLILQKKNVGSETNWLDLMDYPKSKYVQYAEGDDYFTDPHKLQRQVDFLEAHTDFSMCFHPVTVTYEDASKPDEAYPSPEQRFNKKVLDIKDLVTDNFIQTNSVVYRWRFTKESIKDVFPKGVMPGDWLLHILHAHEGKIGFLPETMSVYRLHAGGASWNLRTNKDAFFLKYGVGWLGMQVAALAICSDRPQARSVAHGSVITAFNILYDLDASYKQALLPQALAKYPDEATLYIADLRKSITALDEHAKKQAKIINHFEAEVAHLEQEKQQLAERNSDLEGKTLVRLEHGVKKRVKRALGKTN